MLGLAVLFLLVAIVCYFFGAGSAGALALTAAKIFGVLFIVLLLLSFLLSATAPGPYWGWPVYGRPY